ncbi:branched-chain amino acid ABC transporter permease [Bradyrhizobium sp. WYCCWR 13022]|uniref:branched-chain amino acid ABC transporter permease n=1 Tax=unclassified Bradyrhizobium TaxID=2631580 RepID=UPI00263BE442|nr:branched-chain amino acid ABC transporter permease [Bradyrhizobium sp. WYCCWR 13022]MDN4984314.1 branched-chain amino acid ABC transporter permease [Bradyrhizobium sp. WYCCWR 13022]
MTSLPEVAAVAAPSENRSTHVSSGQWHTAIVLGLLIGVPVVATGFVTFQMTMLLVYAIALIGLNILTGFTGQFSLGQNAFFAIGGYTSVILIEHLHVHYLLSIPIAGIVASLAGIIFAFPALRLKGVYLALATFALGTALPQILKIEQFEEWTGGVQGMITEKPETPFNWPISQDTYIFYLVLAFTVAVYLLSNNLLRSKTGRALLAIRENDVAASAMGVNVAFYKTVAFALSAGVTGIAGALGALVVQFVAPDGYTIQLAVALFLGIVIGGVGWLPGTLVGAAFIVFVPNIAEDISKGLSGAVFGVLILFVIFVLPRGAQQLTELITGRRDN